METRVSVTVSMDVCCLQGSLVCKKAGCDSYYSVCEYSHTHSFTVCVLKGIINVGIYVYINVQSNPSMRSPLEFGHPSKSATLSHSKAFPLD